jgi:hypothetical protein
MNPGYKVIDSQKKVAETLLLAHVGQLLLAHAGQHHL